MWETWWFILENKFKSGQYPICEDCKNFTIRGYWKTGWCKYYSTNLSNGYKTKNLSSDCRGFSSEGTTMSYGVKQFGANKYLSKLGVMMVVILELLHPI